MTETGDRAPALCKTRIMIVENEIATARTTKATLEELGCPVCSVAASGEEALGQARETCPDLILMDISPGGTPGGIETALRIKSDYDIPVVFVSSDQELSSLEQARRAGSFGFLVKPYSGPQLRATIEMALSRYEAEKTIREKERYYRSVIDGINEDIVVIDQYYLVTDANQRFLKSAGKNREEIIGRSCYEAAYGYNAPCYTEGTSCALPEVFETGKPGKCRHAHTLPDGSSAWVEILASPLKDEEGNVTRVIESIRDVTDIVRTEEAREATEKKSRAVIESSTDAILILDTDRIIRSCNPACLELFGYQRGELDGKSVRVIHTSQENFRIFGKEKYPLMEKTGFFRTEWEFVRKDGEIFPAETVTSAIRKPDGALDGYVGVIRDITNRKAAENLLRWELSLNNALARLSHALISGQAEVGDITKLVLHHAKQITASEHGYVSSIDAISGANAGHTLTGMIQDQCSVSGQNNTITFDQGPDGSFQGLSGHSLNTLQPFFTNDPQKHESHRGLPPGHIPIRKFLSVPAVFAGELMGQIALANPERDYTERDLLAVERIADLYALALHRNVVEDRQKRLESQLNQAQKMEAIGTLAGGIAHDFNNILGAMMGFTEMALMHLSVDSPAKSDLEQVIRGGKRAKDLVKQILAFSRQTGEQKRPLKISFILKEAMKFLRATLPRTIEVEYWIDSDSGMVLADPVQIHQIIMNLCSNAEHAMRGRDGILRVHLKSVGLNGDDAKEININLTSGHYMVLTISDTGTGIDPALLDKVFDPFFTTKGPGEGTGLGLSVAHGIVESLGGAITVESQPGAGATFRIFFPRLSDTEEDTPERSVPPPKGSGVVLYVDDEPSLVQVGHHMLERLGYEAVGAASGKEALDLFLSGPERFDLVITDLTMPGMTGIELAKSILANRPGTPIILCTGYKDEVTELKAREAGIREIVMKPFDLRELGAIVERVLKKDTNGVEN